MQSLPTALRFAGRWLRSAPTTSLAVVDLLARGMPDALPVTTAADALLLRPLPYPHPGPLAAPMAARRAGTVDSAPCTAND